MNYNVYKIVVIILMRYNVQLVVQVEHIILILKIKIFKPVQLVMIYLMVCILKILTILKNYVHIVDNKTTIFILMNVIQLNVQNQNTNILILVNM